MPVNTQKKKKKKEAVVLVANRDYYHSVGVTEQNCLNREEISREQEE